MSESEDFYDELPDEELPSEMDNIVSQMIAQADRDIEEARASFYWGQQQMELVKRAAAIIGVPYRDYIKEVVFHQVLRDLTAAKEIEGYQIIPNL